MRALLIGSGYAGLPVDASVDAIYQWLRQHDFADAEIEKWTGPHATRDAMLAGLERLADQDPGDAPVVFYYAGHGHLYRTEIGAGGESHIAVPLLVAIDLDASSDGLLRSVLGSELSRALQKVARRARNLTVLLDCCHATGIVRLDDDLEDAESHNFEQRIHAEASARITARHAPVFRVLDLAPPQRLSERAVVVAASSAGGRAHQHPVTGRLVFTDALLAALDERTTWDAVLADVRARVQAIAPTQYPSVFGPRFRRPLALDERLPDGELYRVEQRGESVVLLAGSLAGIHAQDEFELLTFASTTYGPGSVVGTVRPYAIQSERTVLRAPGAVRVSQPCYARRIRRGDRPTLTIVDVEPDLDATIARIAGHAGYNRTTGPADVRLEVHAGLLYVRDCLDEVVHAVPVDRLAPDGLRRCLHRLDAWRGTWRWLRSDSSGQPLRRCYSLRWGLMGEGGIQPLGGPLVLRPGDALALEVHNLDRGAPDLYVQAFRVCADREIRAWTPEIGAHNLAPHQRAHGGSLRGERHLVSVDAPLGLLPGPAREWTLVATSNLPFDIDPFETPIHARALATGFAHDWGPNIRGLDDDRRFDIVAFPYTLELPPDHWQAVP